MNKIYNNHGEKSVFEIQDYESDTESSSNDSSDLEYDRSESETSGSDSETSYYETEIDESESDTEEQWFKGEDKYNDNYSKILSITKNLNNEEIASLNNNEDDLSESFNYLFTITNDTKFESQVSDAEQNETREEKLLKLLRFDHLNQEEKDLAQELVTTYADQFYMEGDQLEGTDLIYHKITLTDETPIQAKQYKFPHNLKEEVDRQVEQMLKKGIITQSSSGFRSPLWIVPKKMDASGKKKFRVVIDYREINQRTVPDLYPLPIIGEIFDQIGKSKYFSVLDLASGFHQVHLAPQDAHKTSFLTDFGHYQFQRLPFGLRNSPATFQRCMDKFLKGLQGKILFVYIDDIVIYSNTLEEHKEKFKLQIDKCEFLKRKVT